MDDYRTEVIDEFNSTIRNFSGIKNYHVSFSQGRLKEKILVRLWVNELMYDAHNVADILSGDKSFEEQLKDIAAKINAVVTFDIYKV